MGHLLFTFWASTPYVPFVPIGGVERELFFDDAVSNDALIELRRFIIDFIERVEPDTPQILAVGAKHRNVGAVRFES
jgi:hypothetical protein